MGQTRTERTESTLVGEVLGNYRITGELSSGGMGSVYVAEHELLGRRAAIKVLRPDLTADEELVQRFFNEAKAATAIRHPGIIEVFDFGHAPDGRAYLIMELLEGDSLARRIEARGRLSELEAAQIARGIASALVAAHGLGIVHRDLKPDNVFLVPDPDLPSGERPKVLDFGIAKLADPIGLPTSSHQTATGALMGTPLYMAPEQARAAGEIDARADLYSLGCMLYELIVGEPPFVAIGPGEIIALQLFGTPVAPSARGIAISPDLERVVMRLLEKDPAARFQSAAELSDALAHITGRTTVRAPVDDRPTERATAAAPRRARRTLLGALVALAILCAGAAIAVVLVTSRHPATPAAPARPAPPPPAPAAALASPPPAAAPAPQPAAAVDPAAGSAKPAPAAPPRTHTKPAPRDRACGPYATGPQSKHCSPIEDTP